jgi:hypothetical protein
MRLYARTPQKLRFSKQTFGAICRQPLKRVILRLMEVNLHHTKVKADIAVAKVIADLTLKDCVPCIPLSEHQAYDLLAVRDNGRIEKIQVKYAKLKGNGTVEVRFRTSWADRHGTHLKHYSEDDFNYYAIYCEKKDIVLYIPNKKRCPKVIRFDKPKNNQSKFIQWFENYLSF